MTLMSNRLCGLLLDIDRSVRIKSIRDVCSGRWLHGSNMSSFPATYKKEPGVIKVENDGKEIVWGPHSGASPVRIDLESVANLQATPPTSSKHQLRMVCTEGTETVNYQFAFKERSLLDNAKTTLQQLVQKIRAVSQEPTPAPTAAPTKQAIVDLDSRKLVQNLELQKALLKENKELMRTFQETVMQGGLANDKFWNTRIHLLRAFALTSSQKRGAYNVLGTIKPTTGSDNQINVSLTREKIHDIFEQYPIVRHAYNDTVPSKMSEGSFWERFFLSRLYRRLRGEKVPLTHPIDSVLDTQYLTLYEDELEEYRGVATGQKRKLEDDEIHVPQYLDIEGNEENDPQKLGNKPDITMRPGQSDTNTLSLIRSMNSLSQRMLYGNSAARIISSNRKADEDEATELEIQLKLGDLEEIATDDGHIKLHLKENADQGNSGPLTNGLTANLQKRLRTSLDGKIDLQKVSQHPDDVRSAANQVARVIALRAKEESSEKVNWEGEQKLLDQVQICHATSIEFLRHFWVNFLSGDPVNASAIGKLAVSLNKSLERVDAVVASASSDDKEKSRSSLAPLIASIRKALEVYETALKEAGTDTKE
jgi:transcription initiation factor TFIIH subunit 1